MACSVRIPTASQGDTQRPTSIVLRIDTGLIEKFPEVQPLNRHTSGMSAVLEQIHAVGSGIVRVCLGKEIIKSEVNTTRLQSQLRFRQKTFLPNSRSLAQVESLCENKSLSQKFRKNLLAGVKLLAVSHALRDVGLANNKKLAGWQTAQLINITGQSSDSESTAGSNLRIYADTTSLFSQRNTFDTLSKLSIQTSQGRGDIWGLVIHRSLDERTRNVMTVVDSTHHIGQIENQNQQPALSVAHTCIQMLGLLSVKTT